VRTVVEHAKNFGLIIGELDEARARFRDAQLEEELRTGRAETIRQKFIPDLTSGLIDLDAQGKPQGLAGKLFVQPWVLSPERRLDDVVGFDFLIAATSAPVLQGLEPSLWQALQGLGAKTIVIGRDVVERDGLFADWMAQANAQAVLVRPDKYVYGSARDAQELNALVAKLLQGLGLI
jgi:3-(3-hydroxy-phenyl)propionate hydroxylase